MKVSREQFAENRERILKSAAELFREKGLDGVGIADIMKAAGLTHGGFYRHFASKEDLVAQMSRATLGITAQKWQSIVAASAPQARVESLVRHYLSERNRSGKHAGCMFSSLGSDAARQEMVVRGAFTEGLHPLLHMLAQAIPGRSRATRRRKALASMSEMVGAMVLARLVDDAELSREIIAASTQDLLESTRPAPAAA